MDVVKLKAAWDQLVQEARDYHRKAASLNLQIADIVEGKEPVATDISASAANSAIESYAFGVQQELFKAAIKAFSPTGGELVIDKDAVLASLDLRRFPSRFSPDTFWAKLEELYGNGRAERQVYEKAADVLHKKFNLSDQDEVKIVAGTVVLNCCVCIDSNTKKWSQRNALHYSSMEKLCEIGKALAVFAGMVNRPKLCDDLAKNPWNYNGYDVTPRERLKFGENELEVVTFLGNFEFRFSHSLAEEFQVFISTYGPVPVEEAA